MRLVLLSNASYQPPRGGSTRSNLVWIDHLASQGHACRIVAAAAERRTSAEEERYRAELADQALPEPVPDGSRGWVSHRGSVEVRSIPDLIRQTAWVTELTREFEPDWVLVSSEDISHQLLRAAHRAAPDRLVYLAHTPQFFPFGPEAWNPDAAAANIVRRSAGLVVISPTMRRYLESTLGATAAVIHPPIYPSPPRPKLGRPNGSIGMINPCAVKGLPIFLELASSMPDRRFAAIPGWGTTSADRAALAALPNVQLWPAVKDIEEFLADLAALVVPSLWMEGFGLVAMEAMLRGVPVLSSAHGGLTDARMGIPFSIPVHPIERYSERFDERHMPIPEIPVQNPAPWRDALLALRDGSEHARLAAASQEAAERFVRMLNASDLETFLLGLQRVPAAAPGDEHPLTAAQKALLLRRLQAKRK
jgi:glycosyltransferase involved in cell wall biosynthesis